MVRIRSVLFWLSLAVSQDRGFYLFIHLLINATSINYLTFLLQGF